MALLTSACAVGKPRPDYSRAQLEAEMAETQRRLTALSHQVANLQLAVDSHEKTLQEIRQTPAGETPDATSPSDASRSLSVEPIAERQAKKTVDATSPDSRRTPLSAKAAEGKPENPETLYRQARTAYQAGALDRATALFENFGSQYPRHGLADNALYWTGECYYSRKKYLKAIDTFKSVLQKFPRGGKVPDALLKTGYSYLALGDKPNGRKYLQQVVRQYPFSPAGAKAEARLRSIR